MRKTSLSLKKTRVGGVLFWQVTKPKLGGGRERKTFRSRDEAQAFFDHCRVEKENHGTAALSIPESLRVEAVECDRKLREFGKSLRDATEFYLDHLKAVSQSRTVRDVVSELIVNKAGDGASVRYVADLRERLARFVGTFGDVMIATITAKQISDWLRGLGLAGLTRNTFRLRLAALFSYARRCGYVTANPVGDVEKAKEHPGEIEVLSVEQTARLLEAASAETLPYWAIGAFAGLRPAEIERLTWEEVDFEEAADGGFIHVKAAKAKTASRRLVPMSANLREWLSPYRGASGRVCPVGLRKRLLEDRERAALLSEWPQNGLRHSFGSYRLPIIGDAAKLALEMGNSPAMVFAHYREVVKPATAARFWNIRPAAADNVIELTA